MRGESTKFVEIKAGESFRSDNSLEKRARYLQTLKAEQSWRWDREQATCQLVACSLQPRVEREIIIMPSKNKRSAMKKKAAAEAAKPAKAPRCKHLTVPPEFPASESKVCYDLTFDIASRKLGEEQTVSYWTLFQTIFDDFNKYCQYIRGDPVNNISRQRTLFRNKFHPRSV